MASLLHVAPLILGGFLTAAFAQTTPAGHWEGTVKLPDRELQITLDFAKDDKGAWMGAFAQIAPIAMNVPAVDVKVDDKGVKFRIGDNRSSSPDFDCVLENPKAMSCTLTTPGGSVTSAMKRTGEGKVEVPKASPAVSAELEGNWEGTIETPNGAYRIVVHFKNQPDRTVKATLDSLDQNTNDLPLTDVVQQGSAVEFQLRMVRGGFKGTLNKEATEVVGSWSQSGASLPLTLKKSAAK